MKQLLLALLWLCGLAHAQTCTTTLNPAAGGAGVKAAIEGASAGAVICLNSGTYVGFVQINARPSGIVTIRSTTGTGATIGIDAIFRSTNLTFKSLNFSSLSLNDFGSTPRNSNISIVNSTFLTGSAPILVDMGGNSNSNVLFYGNTFQAAYTSTGIEGTIYLTCQPACTGQISGVRIEHNLFDGTGSCADGIQITGGHSGVTIGPGNIFRNWRQSDAACPASPPHVDSWQIVDGGNISVIGNYFENNTINAGIYDGSDNIVISNNVFNGQADAGTQSFQMGAVQGMLFSHNTLKAIVNTGIGTKDGLTPNSGWIIENNILVNGSSLQDSGQIQHGCGSGCIVRNNLSDATSGISLTGSTVTNAVTATPVFVGGASPGSTMSGWKLAPGSPGIGTATDGKDRGTLFRKLDAPANIH